MTPRPILRILLVGFAGGVLWFAPSDAQMSKQPQPDLDAGARIYRQNCINCHGPSGHGDGAAAALLDPKPADLTAVKTQSKPDEALLNTIKFGRMGTSMPGWMSEINEREMRDLLAYIRTLAAP